MLRRLCNWVERYASLPDNRNAWKQILQSEPTNTFLIRKDLNVSTLYINGYAYEVVRLKKDTVEIYNENLDKKQTVPRDDIGRLELNKRKFCQEIANSIELVQDVIPLESCDGFYIGDRRLGKKAYSIFVVFSAFDNFTISQSSRGIPIVFSISTKVFSLENLKWIKSQDGYLINLYDSFEWDGKAVNNLKSIANIVEFKGTLDIPDTQLVKWAKRRPENPTWDSIKIRLSDPDYIFVRFGAYSDNIHYAQLPAMTRKNGKIKQKNKLWYSLLNLADNNEYERNLHKNYIPKLRIFFQDFFELSGDPIPVKKGEIELKFSIEVEPHILKDAKLHI